MSTAEHEADAMPQVTTSQVPTPGDTVVSLDAVTTLIHSFSSMITAMERRITDATDKSEQRIMDQIANNATASKERWSKWEREFETYQETNNRRVQAVEDLVRQHLDQQHEEQIAMAARVEPVKSVASVVARNWRTIVIVIMSILAIIGFSEASLQQVLR